MKYTELEIMNRLKNGKVTEFTIWRLRDGRRWMGEVHFWPKGIDQFQLDLICKTEEEYYIHDLTRWYGKGVS